MLCGCKRKKVKQAMVDDVDKNVTKLARISDDHSKVTRKLINHLSHLLEELYCDDADGVNEKFTKIKKLKTDYEEKEKELDVQKKDAFGSICTLFDNIPIKKRRESGYSSIDSRKLEEYLAERPPELPALYVVMQDANKTKSNKMRHLEQELERCKAIISDINHQRDELTAENKRLKTVSLSKVEEIKICHEDTKSDEHETQALKISTEKEMIQEVHQQESVRHKRNDSYDRMSEYAVINVKENNKIDNKVDELVRSNVAFQGALEEVNRCNENGCIKQVEYQELKENLSKREKEIEGSKLDTRINDERKKLEDDIIAYKEKLAKASEENKNLNAQIYQLKQEASHLKSQLESKKKEIEELLNKKAEHNQLGLPIQGHLEKITNLETEIKNEKKTNEELKSNLKKAEENNEMKVEKISKEIEDLLQDKNIRTKNLTDMEKNVQELRATLLSQKETFDVKVSELTQNLKHVQERNSEAERTLSSLQHDHLELKQMYETAKEELEQLKNIKTIQIQLYHNSRVPLISKVENELKSMLKRELESSATKLEFIDCEKVTDVDQNKPLLILCICASRLGTDAANAIQSLNLTSNMALLVIHHKDGHALPNQASEHVLTGNEFKHLGGIFDFGFLTDKGMYSSELNERNFRNILHFLNKEGARCVSK